MTMVYVLGAFPKVSETFISGEIAELSRQGVDVRIFSLQHPRDPGPQHPDAQALLDRTTYLPTGQTGLVRLAIAALGAFFASPGRAAGSAWWCLRRALTSRNHGELLRFAQAAFIARRLPESAEHIHAHFAHGPATCAAMVSRLSGVPYSFTAHARDIFEYADKRSVHDKVAAAQSVIAISEHGQRRVIDLAGAPLADRVQLVHNGIDLAHFRRRLTEPSGTPHVLCVARLVEKKGQDTLLRAISVLARHGRTVECELIGDGPLREDLERTAEWLGIADRVQFSGAVDAEGVRAAYEKATMFVLPCQMDSNGDQDGLPVSLVEAMAVGVPVVSTTISGIPELITNGVSGLLVEPHDAHALAEAMATVIDDAKLRVRMTDEAHRVAETYDRTKTTRQLMRATGITIPQQRTAATMDLVDAQ
jgi:glycosyltransferase involved in cell wall biosynthesis